VEREEGEGRENLPSLNFPSGYATARSNCSKCRKRPVKMNELNSRPS